jgi:hypothetical protein
VTKPREDYPLEDGPSFAHDVQPLEEELALIESDSPPVGQGPGSDYHANVQAALREAKAAAAAEAAQPKDRPA